MAQLVLTRSYHQYLISRPRETCILPPSSASLSLANVHTLPPPPLQPLATPRRSTRIPSSRFLRRWKRTKVGQRFSRSRKWLLKILREYSQHSRHLPRGYSRLDSPIKPGTDLLHILVTYRHIVT